MNSIQIVAAIWALGAALVLMRLMLGTVAVWWIARRTPRASERARWARLAQTLSNAIGLARCPVLLQSGQQTMPMAWGVWRAKIIMPADADSWPIDRLRIVLLHELAHVRRRDCLTQIVSQLACALYWFNPLVWIAARRMRAERERACDDLVLASGTRGSDYADGLLEIARAMRARRFPALPGLAYASLAMAHQSQLEGRLLAILDPAVPRRSPGRIATLTAATMCAALLLPLGALQLAADAQERKPRAPQRPSPHPSPQPASSSENDKLKAEALEGIPGGVTGGATGGVRDGVLGGVEGGPAGGVQGGVMGGVARGIAGDVTGAAQAVPMAVARALPQAMAAAAPAIEAAADGALFDFEAGQDLVVAGQDAVDKIKGQKRGRPQSRTVDPRAVDALLSVLTDQDAEVRKTAIHALGELRDARATDALLGALNDTDDEVRQQAAFALGQLRDPRAVGPLAELLAKDKAAEVRQQAAFALGEIRDEGAIPGLMAALKDPESEVRQQAVFALGQLRAAGAVDPLTAALKDSDSEVRQQAAFALGELRHASAVGPLIGALTDKDHEVRGQAAFALGQLRDPRAIDALTTALKDENPEVRQQAAFALGQLARQRK